MRRFLDRTRAYIGTPICLVAALSGCSMVDAILEDDPPYLEATIEASTDLNAAGSAGGTPVVFRFYSLKSASTFNTADFFALYEHDQSVLGPDLVEREEWTLVPGESKAIERELSMQTRYIAVMAAYRDWENAVWRASAVTPVDETTRVRIRVDRASLTIEGVR